MQELLGEMERGRSAQQENYWLIQYQKLLDSKPAGVLEAEKNMDPQVYSKKNKLVLFLVFKNCLEVEV